MRSMDSMTASVVRVHENGGWNEEPYLDLQGYARIMTC